VTTTPDLPPPPSRASRALERVICLLIALGFAFVAGIGAVNSFHTVAARAEKEGFPPDLAWTLPAGVDGAILAFTVAGLFRAYKGRPIGWVRPVVWTLVAGTIFLNVASASGPWGYVSHGLLPALYVLAVELVDRIVRDVAAIRNHVPTEGIPVARWMLAPLSTAGIYRRMRLWGVTDYRSALDLERARILARCDLEEQYGSLRKVPARQRALYRLGHLAPVPAPDQAPAQLAVHARARDNQTTEYGERAPGPPEGPPPALPASSEHQAHGLDVDPATADALRVLTATHARPAGESPAARPASARTPEPVHAGNGHRSHASSGPSVHVRLPAHTPEPEPVHAIEPENGQNLLDVLAAAPGPGTPAHARREALQAVDGPHLDETSARQLVAAGEMTEREVGAMLDVAQALTEIQGETGRPGTGAAVGRRLGLDDSTGRRRLARYRQLQAILTPPG
jgi:hypothetical protein